ncbi:SLAC1 family transporter [Cellulomonas sp. P5_C6]
MSTTTLTAGRRTTPVPTSVPPAGPAWFPAVMGTAILATLLGHEAARVPALLAPAAAMLAVAVLLLVGLGAAFVRRVARDRSALTATLRDPAVAPTWGTVAMGLLASGSAVLTVAPQLGGGLGPGALRVDAILWTVGTALGLVTTAGFVAAALTRDVGRPVPAWGLLVVPPMVSATTGAALLPSVGAPLAHAVLLATVVACFVLSLVLGGLVFAVAYRHHVRVAHLPVAASVSAWIPLGIVGQSTAAAQAIAGQGGPLLDPGAAAAVHGMADAFGYGMLALSIPVVVLAVRVTVRGFRAGMPFTPGWWALTFPVGTLALGSLLLGDATGNVAVSALGHAAVVALVGTWTFCAVATARALADAAAR